MNEPYFLSLEFLTSIVDPLETDVWGCGSITPEMIAEADPIREHWNPDDDLQVWSAMEHAGRIRYLAECGWVDPISIDVGVPCLGYHSMHVLDGHHRLAAAVYRKDKGAMCDVQGQLSVIEEFIIEL